MDRIKIVGGNELNGRIMASPILVDDAVMPAAESLPEDLRVDSRLHQ